MKTLVLIVALLPTLLAAQGISPSFLVSTSPLRNSLEGYWRLEETSGVRYDQSKNANHFSTLYGTPASASGVSSLTGNCNVFSPTKGLRITSNVGLQSGASGLTLAAWVKFTTLQASYPVVIGNYRATGNPKGFCLYYDSGLTQMVAYAPTNNSGGSVIIADSVTGTPATNTWYLWIAYYDLNAKTVNIQGNNGAVSSVSAPNGFYDSTNGFCISGTVDNQQVFDGSVDEAGFWSRTLTSTEKTQLYNAGLGTHFPWAHP